VAATERRRHPVRRLLLWIVAIVVAFHVLGGWYFSGVLHERALSGEARRASTDLDPDLVVQAATPTTVVLRADGEAPPELDTSGTFGLRWEGGHGIVGDVLKVEGADVARTFELVAGDQPEAGTRAELDVRVYAEPAEAGVLAQDVSIDGPLGAYPAWLVDGGTDAPWTVVVHGNSLSRLNDVRWLPSLHEAGYPTLTITYRNDAGAPEDPSGLLRYGLTEWEDLEAAVRYALDHGSDGVVLFGDSMGGGVIAAFMQRSPLADRVHALVLDAPMLDFDATVSDNAARETLIGPIHVPPTLTWSAKRIATLRDGVDWGSLRYLEDPQALGVVPVLILHGTEDLTVPIATSREAAARYPATVTLIECDGADHIECWNVDGDALEARVTDFLDQATGSQG
jgi:hypothetical protein